MAAPAAANVIEVRNPATGEVVGSVPDLGADEVALLAAAGRAAQPAWDALGFDGRAKVLRRAQRWLVDNVDRVADTIASETGKTWEDARLAEVGHIANALGFWAKHAPAYLADERVRSSAVAVRGKRLLLRHRPLGLIGVIGPWNYPLVNAFGDALPALAAGNAVLLKPSEITPLTSLLMQAAMLECGMPAGVLQVATGGGATGAAVVDAVDMVMFTGSTETGRMVMARAAERLVPISLELGGKDPMIVLGDADVERAANVAVWGSMQNAGQTCISVERVYVEAPVYEDFVSRVVHKARAVRAGAPGGPGSVEVGAITFPPQVETIAQHVSDALERGARAVVGGHRRASGAGDFFEPTVLVDVDHSMRIMREETFGPTLPIMRVADEDEAIRLANDSSYGLAASVFSRDTERGERVARALQAGAVCVNDALVNFQALELPMGGAKASGLGSRHGAGGIRKYCAQQAILVSRLHPHRDLFHFPYSARTSRGLVRMFRLLWGRGRRE